MMKKYFWVHERNGSSSLSGGWVHILEPIKSNTIKEVKEESDLKCYC